MVFGCSFLLTAAGQFRILTGFPFSRPPEDATSKRAARYSVPPFLSNKMLWLGDEGVHSFDSSLEPRPTPSFASPAFPNRAFSLTSTVQNLVVGPVVAAVARIHNFQSLECDL